MTDMASKSDRIKAEARDLCPACEQTLWISFYFDAFAHHKDDDGEAISNIGKLWNASIQEDNKGIFSNYYSGLGARFEPEALVLATMHATAAATTAAAAEAKIATDALESTREKVLAEARAKKEGWWKRAQRTVNKDLKKLKHAYKNQWDIAWRDPKDRAKYLRRVGRYWKNFANDLIHHPFQIHKYVRNEIAKTVGSSTIEGVGFVRDASIVAALFNTGVDTRLEQAEADFKNNVAVGKSLGKIKRINVAIFGADYGGALALAFADKLANDICKNDKYKGAVVYFRFMGLLDCVCSRFDDNFLTGYIPIANEVKSGLKIPRSLEKVVHYAAAHEYRLYKPLSTINGQRQQGSGKLEERLFPGSQGDVIGGYTPNEQGISNELARLPLQWMLNNAWRNGVPMMTLAKMEKIDPATHGQFRLNNEVKELVEQYWAKARALATEVKTVNAAPSMSALRQGYVDTGTTCMQIPMAASAETILPADVKAELAGHIAMHTAWLKNWHQHYKQGKKTALQNERYEMLSNEIERMTWRSKLSPIDSGALTEDEQKLWAMWQNNSANHLGASKLLFEKYIHDSMADSPIERAWDDLMYSRHYLNHRLITPLEQQPSFDFFSPEQRIGKEARQKVEAGSGHPKPRTAGGVATVIE